MKERVAILGGSFDPIHNGHVLVLKQVVETLRANEGWLLVANQPWHRDGDTAPALVRLEMARVAAQESGLQASDIEIVRGGESYTIDTFLTLQTEYPNLEFHFVLGSDAAATVPNWHRARDLLERAHFVLIDRNGTPPISVADAVALGFRQDQTRLVRVQSPAISASDIRRRCRARESIAGLVPQGVAEIIISRRLYQDVPAIMAADDAV